MIELVSDSRCTQCNLCVQVCPVNVFDEVPDAAPVIARQHDCQTCYMCELYCPVDALYVAPNPDGPMIISEDRVEADGLLGSYRDSIGWTGGPRSRRANDTTFKLTSAH